MAEQQGVFGKYRIEKADGSEVDPAAQYFVLRLDKDHHARVAIAAYGQSVEIENPVLASEIRAWLYDLRYPANEDPELAGYDPSLDRAPE